MERKLKIYLDTSVINFLFADDAPEKRDVTIDFFENYLDLYEVYISDYVIREILKTNNKIKMELLFNAIEKYKIPIFDKPNDEIIILAKAYLEHKILPLNKLDDALHVAFCVYFEFDILLSWNFKHLANINKQDKVNYLNLTYGYRKPILLLNPMEVLYED